MAQKRNAVVVVAAGSGVRAGGGLPKQYQLAGGAAVLRHTLSAFIGHPDIHIIQPVIGADHQPLFDEYCDGLDVEPPVAGGAERQASVIAGLKACSPSPLSACRPPAHC